MRDRPGRASPVFPVAIVQRSNTLHHRMQREKHRKEAQGKYTGYKYSALHKKAHKAKPARVATTTDAEPQPENPTMNAPKLLPWIARKAGISDELALKLWRRAASEAEYLTGKSSGSEYHGLAIERLLTLVEDEACLSPNHPLTSAPQLTWVWRHQTRISLLSLMAAQNTYRFWQSTWENLYPNARAA